MIGIAVSQKTVLTAPRAEDHTFMAIEIWSDGRVPVVGIRTNAMHDGTAYLPFTLNELKEAKELFTAAIERIEGGAADAV